MGNQEKPKAIVEIKESVRLSKWQSEIEERQASGFSVDAWCSRQGISKNTYYCCLRKAREHLCKIIGHLPEEQRAVPTSTSIRGSAESKIEIRHGDLPVSYTGIVSSDALKTVIEALQIC